MIFWLCSKFRAMTCLVAICAGGYMKSSARVIADSITNLAAKRLISLPSGAPQAKS
jgi:histone deacetylase 11